MRPGHILNGRYRLDARIGLGGMGEVWRATDARLERVVAIKLLRLDLIDNPDARKRFRQEALTLAALNVPGTAQIHDTGEDDVNGDIITYLVMEYVRGTTLSDVLARHGALSVAELAPILEQLARPLDFAHRNSVVHRDIKPSNIMVADDGRVTLLDFGIAQSVDDTKLTLTGQFMGTLSYVSPEQFNGDTVGPESDVYSLGVVAFQCLEGEPPFTGAPAEVLNGHLTKPPPKLPDEVPAAVAKAITRALAKEPANRFASVSDFVSSFYNELPDTRPRAELSALRRHNWLLLTGGGILAIAVLVVAAAVFLPWRSISAPLIASDSPSGDAATDGEDRIWIPDGLEDGTLIDSQLGVFYKVGENGDLHWYRHMDYTNGAVRWDRDSGKRIGGDWKDRKVVAGCAGVLYAMDDTGNLYWYKHTDPDTGADKWSEESGTLIGRDYDEYRQLIVTSAGVIYALDDDGNLTWRAHSEPKNGQVTWKPGADKVVDDNWGKDTVRLSSGCDNSLMYTVSPAGKMEWRIHLDPNGGIAQWYSETIDDSGWDRYDYICASAGGVIYARTPDGEIYWYRHASPEFGEADWAKDSGRLITPD